MCVCARACVCVRACVKAGWCGGSNTRGHVAWAREQHHAVHMLAACAWMHARRMPRNGTRGIMHAARRRQAGCVCGGVHRHASRVVCGVEMSTSWCAGRSTSATAHTTRYGVCARHRTHSTRRPLHTPAKLHTPSCTHHAPRPDNIKPPCWLRRVCRGVAAAGAELLPLGGCHVLRRSAAHLGVSVMSRLGQLLSQKPHSMQRSTSSLASGEGLRNFLCASGSLRGWCGVAWRGVAWHGVVWCGVVWCGVAWRGVAWRVCVFGREGADAWRQHRAPCKLAMTAARP
jgi:hypothetical protein